MRVGILEISSLPSRNLFEKAYNVVYNKQITSITPQAISVWCRQLGHESFYATYYGCGNIENLLPKDLDIVFIASTTYVSALAYAMAKIYRKAGVRTVIGGAHAKAFPADCLRFFDLVVKECDKNLIADILNGHFDPGTYISSAQPCDDFPSVEERAPEIRATALILKRWYTPFPFTVVPVMTSTGCPYTCDFCIDWNTPYRLLSMDSFAEDLKYINKHFPKAILGFWEPNFAVKFDRVFEVLESYPPESRLPYAMEFSQSILSSSRIKRMKETNCRIFMCGIESWADYSAKAGVGKYKTGEEKLKQTIKDFEELDSTVPLVQCNFIFGLDSDQGDEPVSLTKEFIRHHAFAWPTVNIPTPYGGTPLQESQFREGRILEEMPFTFYITPYLTTTIKNYDPVTYYEKLMELSAFNATEDLYKRRIARLDRWQDKLTIKIRTMGEKWVEKQYRQRYDQLRSDSQFRAFHEGKKTDLPEHYHQEYEQKLGPYASLLTRADRRPNLEQLTPECVGPKISLPAQGD